MAAYTIDQLLGYVYLTGVVEAIKTGIPDLLPPEFMSIKKQTLKDQGRYTRVQGSRQTARRIEYGAPTVKRPLVNVGTFDVKLLTAGEYITLDLEAYMSLRAYDSYQVMNMGMQELDRQALQFRTLFDNLEIGMIYSMLANGKIWFDAGGNLLPTSSGSTLVIDYGVSANHMNQLNGLIDISWKNPSADIPTDMLQIRDQSLFDTGYELGVAFYGRNIPSYLAQNALAVEYLARHVQFRDKFLQTGEIPDGLFGIDKWIRVSSAFFADQNGTNQTFFSGDQLVLVPPVSQAWYEMMEGQLMVPTSFNPFATMSAAVGSFDIKYRRASWATPVLNPISADVHYKFCGLPILKFPDSIYIATVAF